MSSPNILSLPREIRSMIYAHISDDIAFDWGWRMLPFPIGGYEIARVRVPEVPLTNVLLSCRQIYHEYSQEKQFRKSVIAICLFGNAVQVLPEGRATNHERVLQVLQKVHKIHFVVLRTPQADPGTSWKRIKGYNKMIETLAPRLEMMGIVVRVQKSYVARDMRSGAVMSTGLEPSVFVARLRAQVQQEYGSGATCTSAYAACNKTLNENDIVVGEWRLRRAKGGLAEAIGVK